MSSANAEAGPRSLVGRLNLQQYVVYFGFLAIFLFFAVMLGDSGFLTVRNLSNIVLQTAPVTIMAIGLVFVMSAGEIDLSIGSIVAVAALAAAVVMSRYGMAAAVVAGLACGLGIGLINGLLVAYVKLPSFLVTLATLGLFAGVSRSMTDLRSIPVTDPVHRPVRLGNPARRAFADLVDGACHPCRPPCLPRDPLRCTRARHRRQPARGERFRHQRRPKVRLAVLMISGGLAGLAGLLYAGRLQAAKYTLGETDLMTVIAAVIVGGTLLNGGKGSIVGALVGSLMMGMLNNGLILMGLSVSDQMIVRGFIILAAVAVSLREKNR